MRSASIWTIACAAALTFACSDNANRNNNTATGTDRTSAPADRAPGTATPTGTSGADQSTARDTGTASTIARANNASDDHAFVEKMAQANIAEVKLEKAFHELHREIWQMLKSEVMKGYAQAGAA